MKLLGIVEKLRKFHGVGQGAHDKQPLEWKLQGDGGLRQKCPSWEGAMDIFWNYTERCAPSSPQKQSKGVLRAS